MLTATLALGWRVVLVALSGVGAGVANAIAGGGTFLTFPTLLALGVPALTANVTTTVGVVPSYLGTLRGLAAHRAERAHAVRPLLWPAALGTVAGTVALLAGSTHTFDVVIPWLIGAATVLFAAGPWLSARLATYEHDHPARRGLLAVGVFAAAAYGGYFGAGLGIVLLAVLEIGLALPLRDLQGVRSTLSLLISGLAAAIFVVRGHLALFAVATLLPSTLVGGWLGAKLLTVLRPGAVRVVILAIGVATTLRLALH